MYQNNTEYGYGRFEMITGFQQFNLGTGGTIPNFAPKATNAARDPDENEVFR